MSLTFSQQSQSLMLPPFHPPAVTKMALNLVQALLTESSTNRLLIRGVEFSCRRMFLNAEETGLKSTLKTWYLDSLVTTDCPSWPAPPMQRIFFITNIIITMLLDNEFLSSEERNLFHLKTIIYYRQSPHETVAQRFADASLSNVVNQIQRGQCQVSQTTQKIEDLMISEEVPQIEQQREERKRKVQLKQLRNNLLYYKNKNKQASGQKFYQLGLLPDAQHFKFIQQMKKDNSTRRFNRTKLQQSEQAEREAELKSQRQLSEAARMLEIQRRKQAIKQSLKKMRENHLFLVQQQQESKKIFNKVTRKKRLYERMKESYDQISAQILHQKQERALKERQKLNKLDLSQIVMHQRQYEDWKKKQSSQLSRVKQDSNSKDLPSVYQPPAHSQKISQFLSEQAKSKNKIQLSKRLATQKLHRIVQYTSVVRQKYKPKSPPASKNQAVEKGKSFETLETDKKKTHTQLGNQYLKQAKLIIRKRAKTEERSLNPQNIDSSRSKPEKDKYRTATLSYLPERKKKDYVERMKRQQIESILKGSYQNESQRLQKLRLADERLSRELHKKQTQMKLRYSTENSQNTLALLLGTIRAKINLIDCYNTKR